MFLILGILAAGAIAGYLARRLCERKIPDTGGLLTWTVRVMLLAFGASIGVNDEIMDSLPTLGLRGAALGISAMTGSALCCMLLERLSGGIKPAQAPGSPSSGANGLLRMASGSAMTVLFFGTGVACGTCGTVPDWANMDSISEWILRLLIALVGFGVGSNPHRETGLTGRKASVLLVAPVSVAGTAIAGIAAGIIPWGYDVGDSVCAVSGMGYYSLSSLLIVDLKGAAGLQLGAVALLGNIFRELTALVFAPVIGRRMGAYALTGAAGVTSLDVLLPSIRNACGEGAVGIALVNGVMLEIACPLIITAACML